MIPNQPSQIEESVYYSAYAPRIIAFLDILGFKDLIQKTLRNTLAFDLTYLLLTKIACGRSEWDASESPDAWEHVAKPAGMTEQQHETMVRKLRSRNKATAFSDHIVLSAPFDWAGVAYVVAAATTVSLHLLKGGAFLRGGIVAGLLVHEDNLVFGPDLIKAYEVEEGIAKFPRVVLDRSTENQLMEIAGSDLHTSSLISNLLRTDQDSVTHIHILGRYAMATAGQLDDRQRFLQFLHEIIVSRYRDAVRIGNMKATDKLRWFASYYNHAVSTEPEVGVMPVLLDTN